MGSILPVWLNVYSIVTSILFTIVLFGFCIQTIIYKYNQKDELTTTYSVLAAIGLSTILSSCASSYVYTCCIAADDATTFYELWHWVSIMRNVPLFSQMLFLVWRLELTFVRTNYQLSKIGLISYHITIVASVICHLMLSIPRLDWDIYGYFYVSSELLRVGVFFGVSYQFVNKLFDLIASQHSSIIIRYDFETSAQQLLNQLKGELKLALESQMDDSLFTEKNYKLISIMTKLSFLSCIDFITLFVYFIFGEIYTMLLDNNAKLRLTFSYIIFVLQPFSWLMFSLNVWFSFTFAEKQYLCLFGCCHRRFMKYFDNKAKKRTIKRQVESLTPSLKASPMFGALEEKYENPNELELDVIES